MYRGLFFIFCIGFVACSNMGDKKSEATAEKASYFKIALSSGGGFTGIYRGYSLYGDGRVEAWQSWAGKGDSLLWQGVVERGEVERIRGELQKSGALDKRFAGAGNMTAVVAYETADTTYRWSWDRTREGPVGLSEWYEKTRAFCAEEGLNVK
jgi:hypothetical protein